MTKPPKTELEKWLESSKIVHTLAGSALLVFDPPPSLYDAHGAVITAAHREGRAVARLLRARSWATRCVLGWELATPDSHADAMRWLVSLGYGRKSEVDGRRVVRIPAGGVIYGQSKINLTVVAGFVVSNPAITSRKLAEKLTAIEKRRIDREAANRAMNAIGWGPDEREAFREGTIGAPVLVAE